jgi:hypothetical protein
MEIEMEKIKNYNGTQEKSKKAWTMVNYIGLSVVCRLMESYHRVQIRGLIGHPSTIFSPKRRKDPVHGIENSGR